MANPYLTLPRAYDSASCKLLLGGWQPYGFAEGSKITISRNEDHFNTMVGADGEFSVGINRNESGTITIQIQETAKETNAILASWVTASKASRLVGFPVYFEDPTGLSLISPVGIVMQQGDYTVDGDGIPVIEWTIWVSNASMGQSAIGAGLGALGSITPNSLG
jgi:hypothetical protein